jgi:hypothetical protein
MLQEHFKVGTTLQIAEEGFLETPADAEIDIGEAKVSRLVIEAGIAAIDQPAKSVPPSSSQPSATELDTVLC